MSKRCELTGKSPLKGHKVSHANNKMKRKLKMMKKRVELIPIKRMAEPNEISAYIVSLTTDSNSYMTGQTVTVSGGE